MGKVSGRLPLEQSGKAPGTLDPEPGDLFGRFASRPRRESRAMVVAPLNVASSARVVLVLGGARSGKSAFAESLIAARCGTAIYVATAEAGDAEMAARIAAHRARRGRTWQTVEAPIELAATIERESRSGNPILVDCLTLWMSNLIGRAADPATAGDALVTVLGRARNPIVLVSNEVGQGIVPENALARRFADDLGYLNQRVAAVADAVFLLAAGLPLTLKKPSMATLP